MNFSLFFLFVWTVRSNHHNNNEDFENSTNLTVMLRGLENSDLMGT